MWKLIRSQREGLAEGLTFKGCKAAGWGQHTSPLQSHRIQSCVGARPHLYRPRVRPSRVLYVVSSAQLITVMTGVNTDKLHHSPRASRS